MEIEDKAILCFVRFRDNSSMLLPTWESFYNYARADILKERINWFEIQKITPKFIPAY